MPPRGEREAVVLNRVKLRAGSRPDTRVFRNNIAKGWVGQLVKYVPGGQTILFNARRLHAGLFPGSGDLIGWHTIEITPAMVGRKVAVFLNIEVKQTKGRERDNQINFARAVKAAGGISFVARCEEDVDNGLA